MEELIINLNNKEFKAQFDPKNSSLIYINSKPFQIDLLKSFRNNIYSYSVNQKLCQVEYDFDDSKNLIISFDGISYQITVSDETGKMLDKYLQSSASKIESGIKIIKAPMPGMIVKVVYKEGEYIQKDDKLIIIEAMKMENAIKSPINGNIKHVFAKEGNAVEKDAPLLEITPVLD